VGLGGDDDNQELFELLSRVSVAINSRYDLSGSSPETLDPDTVQNLVRMLQSRRSYYEDQIRLEQLVERPASLARFVLWEGTSGLVSAYRQAIEIIDSFLNALSQA